MIQETTTPSGRRGRKTKTGCLTCKIRRVKCDEGHPKCLRCIKSGRICDGYVRDVQFHEKLQDWKPEHLTIVSPERLLSTFRANEQERRSFAFYRNNTASVLAHALDSDFWNGFVLQVSHSEPAVRHALTAIGGLNERLRLPTVTASSTEREDRILSLSLSSYNKAISCIMAKMCENDSEWLLPLLTCILFVCIEFLQNNITEALSLLHQGCAIFQGVANRRAEECKVSPERSSSHQFLVDNHVFPIFRRLTVLSALCGRPVTLKLPEDDDTEDALQFHDLRTARKTLYQLMDRGHELVRKATDVKWRADPDSHELGMISNEQLILQQKLSDWHRRFSQLQVDLELSNSAMRIQAVSILSMYHTTTKIWVATLLEKSQFCFDTHFDEFKHVLEAAELVVNLTEGQGQGQVLFTFEMGLIPPLYFTASKCRDMMFRRQAVSLMERAPGREGLWNREEMVRVAKKIIDVEERGGVSKTGVPEEVCRLHDVQFSQENAGNLQRQTVVKYLSKPDGLDGPWRAVEDRSDC